MARAADQTEERVLVLAPIGRDAQAAAQQLAESNFACLICSDIDDLLRKLGEGAAVALVAEEAFLRGGTHTLEQWVAGSPHGRTSHLWFSPVMLVLPQPTHTDCVCLKAWGTCRCWNDR